MSKWFVRHRQEFIRAQLEVFGQIRRADICDRFEVSVQQASTDIAKFLTDHPDAMIYDGKAKVYVLDKEALGD